MDPAVDDLEMTLLEMKNILGIFKEYDEVSSSALIMRIQQTKPQSFNGTDIRETDFINFLCHDGFIRFKKLHFVENHEPLFEITQPGRLILGLH